MEDLDARGGKRLGPMIVAKAWADPAFKAELLANAGDAVEKLGIQSSNFAPKPKPAGRCAYQLAAFAAPWRPCPICSHACKKCLQNAEHLSLFETGVIAIIYIM